jgi:hypothetical protein
MKSGLKIGQGGQCVNISKVIPVLIIVAAAPPAHADTRSDIIAGIERCGVMNDNKVWLDCVYGAIQPMRAQLGLQPAPEFQQRLVPPAQMASAPAPQVRTPQIGTSTARPPAPRRKPGFFSNLLNAPPVAVSKMASYRYERSGAFVVALENGQQWRQTELTAGTVSWSKEPASYTVTITEGAFGSYSLRTSDNPRTYKVEPFK